MFARVNGRTKTVFLLSLPLVILFIYLLGFDTANIPLPSLPSDLLSTAKSSPLAIGKAADFWNELFALLERVKPDAWPVRPNGSAPLENWSPDVNHPPEDRVSLSDADASALRRSHSTFVSAIPTLESLLPYDANSTGIVTTAGQHNFGHAVTMVLMVRQTGSRLPIDIVLDSTAPWVDKLCATKLTALNATCIHLSNVWAGLAHPAPHLERYQWKIAAILASRRQHLLFLDADVYPVLCPDDAFAPGAEPYASTGMVTWPDFWTPSPSHFFYDIAGDLAPSPLNLRSTAESGIMMVDKARHGDTLLLVAYYNVFGFSHFYPLLSQGGPGEGDKETFLQAALVLNELRRKNGTSGASKPSLRVWDVKKLPMSWGRTLNDQWRGMFMQQMDPMEDYRVVKALLEGGKGRGQKQERKGAESPVDADNKTGGPAQAPENRRSFLGGFTSLDQGKANKATDDGARPPQDAAPLVISESDTAALLPDADLYGDRYMFFHHNGVKLDFFQVVQDPQNNPMLAKDNEGRYVRLWGDTEWLVKRTGRDVEKDMWKASAQLYCEAGFEDVCHLLQDFYLNVY